MSDPQKYRAKEEIVEHEEADCINRMVNDLIDRGFATQQQVIELDRQAKRTATDAVRFATDSPDPNLDQLYTDVYADPYPPFIKGELPEKLQD